MFGYTSNTRTISLLYRHNILTTSTPTQPAHTPHGEVGCYPLTPTGTQAHQDATSGFNFAMVNLTTLGETEFRNENGTKLRSGRNNLLDLTIVHAPSTAGRGYGFLEYVAEAAERKWGYGAVVGIVVNPRKSIQAPTLLPTESMYQIILDEIRGQHHWDIPQEYSDSTVGWWMSLYGMIIRDDYRPVPPLELRSGLWKPGYPTRGTGGIGIMRCWPFTAPPNPQKRKKHPHKKKKQKPHQKTARVITTTPKEGVVG